MPAIPSIASFTAPTVTEGEFKTALSNLHLFLSGLLGTTGTAADAQAALGALLGAGVTTKTGAYTVQPEDRGKVVACSGTFTVTLPDAGAVGDGFAVSVANYGTGTITVDPYSTQTIDGATTRELAANTMLVACAVAGEWLTTLPTASTSQAGIVQLSTSTSSTSTTLAATASAVKAAYDLANSKLSSLVPSNKGVGEVVVAWNTATSNVAAGSTIAGSSLLYTTSTANRNPFDTVSVVSSASGSSFPTTGTTALSGTWRAIVYSAGRYISLSTEDGKIRSHFYPGLFIRVS